MTNIELLRNILRNRPLYIRDLNGDELQDVISKYRDIFSLIENANSSVIYSATSFKDPFFECNYLIFKPKKGSINKNRGSIRKIKENDSVFNAMSTEIFYELLILMNKKVDLNELMNKLKRI